MDIEKLKETLKANGIDEEKIEKIIDDLEKEPAEGEPTPNPNENPDPSQGEGEPAEGEPAPNPEEEKPDDENPSENNEGDPNEEGGLPPDVEVPPTPNPEELPPDVPPSDVPPVEPTPVEVPPAPSFDPTELIEKVEEQGKTIEGLLARIDSLQDALKGAGILEKADDENIGFENQGLPGTSSAGADSAMVSALNKLNNRR